MKVLSTQKFASRRLVLLVASRSGQFAFPFLHKCSRDEQCSKRLAGFVPVAPGKHAPFVNKQ